MKSPDVSEGLLLRPILAIRSAIDTVNQSAEFWAK